LDEFPLAIARESTTLPNEPNLPQFAFWYKGREAYPPPPTEAPLTFLLGKARDPFHFAKVPFPPPKLRLPRHELR
jgi:hypothetical protein